MKAGGTRKSKPLNIDQVISLAADHYIELDPEAAAIMVPQMEAILTEIYSVDDIAYPSAEVRYSDRTYEDLSTLQNDIYNVFVRRCLVKGAPEGKLAGLRIGIKDNIKVADIPMSNGSRVIEDFVPEVDAIVVERILDNGGTIVGKLNLDSFSMGATGESSEFGPTMNPHNTDYSPGGSSAGSGAAVAAGEVDVALGVDQGGSARIPASWCGVVAMKATHGLVPSFGISYVDHTLDNVCPMARTVSDVATTLEVIAGEDVKDPQWVRGPLRTKKYGELLDQDIAGVRVGVIEESLMWSDSERDVNESVLKRVEDLKLSGVQVNTVSLPWWKNCEAVILAIMTHSLSAMVESDLEGYWRGGLCDPAWQEVFGQARRESGHLLNPLLIVHMILAKYLQNEHCSVYFSKAQNVRHTMTGYLDDVLKEYDVLVTPTTPMKAVPLPTREETKVKDGKQRSLFRNNRNTCPLNLTGHPAISLPSGISDSGLPIGIQLIGRYFEEDLLFMVASTIEEVVTSEQ